MILQIMKYDFRKTENGLQNNHRIDMSKIFKELPPGEYTLEIVKRSTYRGRYKYYFAYLLPEIINQVGFKVQEHDTGELRTGTVDELHEVLKVQFNPVSVQSPMTGGWSVTGGTTTKLSDGEFIARYEEEIAALAANRGAELISRSEWVLLKKSEKFI